MSEGDPKYRYQIPAIPHGDGVSFFGEKSIMDVDNYSSEVWAVLEQCEGHKTINDILETLADKGYDEILIEHIVEDLDSMGAITDSRKLYKWFHNFTNNPTPYYQALSNEELSELSSREYKAEKMGKSIILMEPREIISAISKSRETTRQFSDKPLDVKQISEVLGSAYSFNVSPVPSAGGLYPLKIYTIIRKKCEIPKGYYQFDPVNNCLIMFNDEVDERRLQHAFNSDPTVFDAPVLFVIAADMDRQPEKYANRGYRYTILEAGHVAQNIALTTESLDMGSVEYGGYNDKDVISELQLDEGIAPLTVIGIGNKIIDSCPLQDLTTELENYYLGDNKPITDIMVSSSERLSEFGYYHAVAHYKAANDIFNTPDVDRYGSGVATSMDFAKTKAIAEAYERYCSGLVKYDVITSADELDGEWLHPDSVKPLDDHQNQVSSLSRFKTSDVIGWVRAERAYSKAPIYVPADLIYYPFSEKIAGRKLVTTSNSSGVAAFSNEATAIKKALYELKERDALMKNWLNKRPLPKLNHQLLSQHWKRRVQMWKELGYAVDVIDMSDYEACMINVVIRNLSIEYPFFSSGASATDSYETAIDKAFEESEVSLIYKLDDQKVESKPAHKVFTPEDHGDFYFEPTNRKYIEWLWQGTTNKTLKHINKKINLVKKYDPVIIRLNQTKEPLSVVRAISTELVPISFGLGLEYYRHPFSGANPNTYQANYAPHFFA